MSPTNERLQQIDQSALGHKRTAAAQDLHQSITIELDRAVANILASVDHSLLSRAAIATVAKDFGKRMMGRILRDYDKGNHADRVNESLKAARSRGITTFAQTFTNPDFNPVEHALVSKERLRKLEQDERDIDVVRLDRDRYKRVAMMSPAKLDELTAAAAALDGARQNYTDEVEAHQQTRRQLRQLRQQDVDPQGLIDTIVELTADRERLAISNRIRGQRLTGERYVRQDRYRLRRAVDKAIQQLEAGPLHGPAYAAETLRRALRESNLRRAEQQRIDKDTQHDLATRGEVASGPTQ